MAEPTNAFTLDPSRIARVATALVSKDLVVASTVNRSFEAEFGLGMGASVNVRTPATLKAARRALADTTTPMLSTALTEGTQSVAIEYLSYQAVTLSDVDLSLKIEDFSKQVLAPQALAIAEDIEDFVISKLQAVVEDAGLEGKYTAGTITSLVPTFLLARKTLRDMGAPMSNLYAVVGTTVYQDVLAYNASVGANGGNGDANANTGISRLAGFTVIESNRVGATEIIIYHRDAITLVLRAPIVPQGAAFGQSVSENGAAIRWIRDYDSVLGNDRSVLSVFMGAKLLTAKLSSDGSTPLFALRVNDGVGV